MTVVDGGAVMQSRLSLRHVSRVLAAVSSNHCLRNLLLVICYATSCDAAVAAQTEFNSAMSSRLDSSGVSIIFFHCLFAKNDYYLHVQELASLVESSLCTRDVTKFEFDNVRTSNVFGRFEIRRMF